jgi:hypothetical protein
MSRQTSHVHTWREQDVQDETYSGITVECVNEGCDIGVAYLDRFETVKFRKLPREGVDPLLARFVPKPKEPDAGNQLFDVFFAGFPETEEEYLAQKAARPISESKPTETPIPDRLAQSLGMLLRDHWDRQKLKKEVEDVKQELYRFGQENPGQLVPPLLLTKIETVENDFKRVAGQSIEQFVKEQGSPSGVVKMLVRKPRKRITRSKTDRNI